MIFCNIKIKTTVPCYPTYCLSWFQQSDMQFPFSLRLNHREGGKALHADLHLSTFVGICYLASWLYSRCKHTTLIARVIIGRCTSFLSASQRQTEPRLEPIFHLSHRCVVYAHALLHMYLAVPPLFSCLVEPFFGCLVEPFSTSVTMCGLRLWHMGSHCSTCVSCTLTLFFG